MSSFFTPRGLLHPLAALLSLAFLSAPAHAAEPATAPSTSTPAGSNAAPATAAPAQKGGPPRQAGPATVEELLAQVTVPPEFDVNVFATADQANYPASIAAAPDGTLYVASDGNSSLGTDLGRGRIVRLRDTDGDGRADEVRQFAKVDSPRGLVWDVDRLYVMAPPHVYVFIDRDGDGVAEEQKILVKDIAFSFRDRPADHSSNGVTLGIDGWIYLAIGDFGFLNAEGADGRRAQFRSGGVWRVRPDGSGLELFSRGTRNILEVALSPRLDGFARDNTNDGDGWDIRLHHFSGLENHGYPTLFKNFAGDFVAPLADYGGGSGCGSLWIDEPGIPEKWRGLITVDWARERSYHHTLTPSGATFSATQEEFARLPRATDLDADARGHIYAASWRGGQYNYAGPHIGFIARLTPKGAGDKTPALPNFATATNAALIELFNSPSARTRLEAQRRLLRRELKSDVAALEKLASDSARSLDTRILALFTLKQALGEASHAFLGQLATDASVAAWAIRALTNHEGQLASVPDAPLLAGLKSPDAPTRRESAIALARLGRAQNAAALTALLDDRDAVIVHTAVQALVRLNAADAALAVVDDATAPAARRTGALRVLQALHDERVVDALIARLGRETAPERRESLVRVLCRLYYVEGKWTGDSWGTRPDTRGPYYQPERWSASAKINTVLKDLLDRAEGEDAAKLNALFTLHRVTPGDTTARLMTLAANDETLLPTLALQLAAADTVPAAAIPLLQRAIVYVPAPPAPPPAPATNDASGQPAAFFCRCGGPRAPDTGPTQIAAMQALVKASTTEAIEIVLQTLPTLQNRGRLGDGVRDKSANALFRSPTLGNHRQLFAREAAKLDGERSTWADAALLHLSAQKFGAPETLAFSTRELDEGWKTPARRAQIIRAAVLGREASRASAIVQALDDADADVAAAAKSAVATLKLDVDAIRAEAGDRAPAVASLKPDELLALVAQQRGTVARGEQVFAQAGCVACHTVNASEPLKGPFLGNIARLYPRRELAEHIIDPNKAMAQGFVTNLFTLKDGTSAMGFVTRESADKISIRDIAGQEREIAVAQVAKREHLPTSLMPPGLMNSFTVRDFAALLDYLQSLADAGK